MPNAATPKVILLPLGVAAAISGVHPKKLNRMADAKKVRVGRTSGGHRRFHKDEMERLAATGGVA